ncbi:MAG: TlpA family protein disulfide reductase [Burkholderiales bacterium]|nr:TlpA family protein disulfide reductase [Burkholderiales bacterium]
MNRRQWLGGGAAALAAGALGAWVASKHYSLAQADQAATELLLALDVPDAEGQPHPLAPWRGHPLLVNFWATWCPPCVDEMPELSGLQREFSATPLKVVGIGIDSAANIRRFSQKSPMSYPLLVAGASGSELARRFGNGSGALPFTVVIDHQGRVRRRILGRFELASLRASVKDVLRT